MSTLFVNNLNTASGSTITVPTGKKIVVTDAGGVQVPHMVAQIAQYQPPSGTTNTSAATWVNTNYTLAITPSLATSKIMVHFHIPFRLNGTGTYMRGGFRLNRAISGGATNLIWNTSSNVEQFQVRNASNEHDNIMNMTILDAPATTSQVTYTMQSYFHSDSGTNYIDAEQASYGGNILLQEILQ
jgi:hypothetical protein